MRRPSSHPIASLLLAAACAFPVAAAELVSEITAGSEPVCAAFDPCGRHFAVGSRASKMIDIWDPDTGKQMTTLKSHEADGVLALAFSPDGKLLASAGRDDSVRIWYIGNGKALYKLSGHKNDVNSVDFSVDGTLLASGGSDNKVILWDVRSGQMMRELEGHTNEVTVVRFGPNGDVLATAGKDLTVRLWEARSGNWLRTLKGPVLPITSLAFTPDGKRLACGDEDGKVHLFEVENGKLVKSMAQHSWGGRSNWPITSVLFFQDGEQIITAGADGTVKVWDVTSGKFVQTIRAHVGGVAAVALSRDGKLLLTAGSSVPVQAAEGYALGRTWGESDKKTIKVWDAASARLPLSHPAEPKPIAGLPPEQSEQKKR